MQLIDRPEEGEERYESLKEELIGYYRKELVYIYTYHNRPPAEYNTLVKDVIARLIPHFDGRKLNEVLAECWRWAWYREPVCHPNTRYVEG